MTKVLVVPRDTLFGENYFSGFKNADDTNFLDTIRDNNIYIERKKAEKDESHKQIIPYCVFKHKGKVFLMKRLNVSEKRLRDKYSIGIGGHIHPEDGEQFIENAMKREFNEEVSYNHSYKVKLIGFVNDDKNPVGRVHFGVVFIIEGDSPEIAVSDKESRMLEGQLVDKEEIEELMPHMEGWSKIVSAQIWD